MIARQLLTDEVSIVSGNKSLVVPVMVREYWGSIKTMLAFYARI